MNSRESPRSANRREAERRGEVVVTTRSRPAQLKRGTSRIETWWSCTKKMARLFFGPLLEKLERARYVVVPAHNVIARLIQHHSSGHKETGNRYAGPTFMSRKRNTVPYCNNVLCCSLCERPILKFEEDEVMRTRSIALCVVNVF